MARANAVAAVLIFAALTAVVALQVLNRMVLHLPIIWSEEAARFLFFWVVMLGAAMSVRTRRHFVLDLSMGRRRPADTAPRFVLDAVPDFFVLAFAVFLLVEGLGYARTGALRTATNSGIGMGLVYAAIPAFAALSILYSARNLRASHRAFREGRPRRPPAAVDQRGE
jgi:TRAP-type C4-dicarboxylate transport system permease small subunit